MSTALATINVKDLCEKILMFCEELGQIKCYTYQREFALRVIESIVIGDGEEISALMSRQSGKTEAVGVLVSGLMVLLPILAQSMPMLAKFKKGIWVGIFAPVFSQGSTTYDRVRLKVKSKHGEMILSDPELNEKAFERKGSIIDLSNESLCRVQSASKQSKIESKTYHLIIIEEAQDVDEDKCTRSIHPMGAAVNATILKIGTCGIQKGDFYKTCVRTKEASSKKGAKKNYFFYDYKRCQKENPNYKKYIVKEKERLGEDSDAFRMSYKLEWLLERGMFCTQTMLEDLFNKDLGVVSETKGGIQVAGIDFGKQQSSTVVTVLDLDDAEMDDEGNMLKILLNWLEIEGDNYEKQYPRILEFLARYKGLKGVGCDNTGVGQPIVDRLIEDVPSNVTIIPVNLNLSKSSEVFVYFQKEILANRFIVPASRSLRRALKWQRFCNQMVDVEKSYKGRYMSVSKPTIRDARDDYVYSGALACWASATEIMPEIESFDKNDFFGR